jgi:hypothetical protein
MTGLEVRAVETAGPFERLCALLEMVDEVHAGESGSIVFGGGSKGIILVQSGRICWAASSALAARLSHRIRRDATVDDRQLAAIFRECRESGKPFGETLVARGVVTFEALRTALLQHTAEALLHLALEPSPVWVPATIDHYDRSLTFPSAELLTHSADGWWGPLAAEARNELAAAIGDRAVVGLAFLRDTGTRGAIVPVGVVGAGELSAKEVLAAGRAAAALMHSGGPLGARLIASTWVDGRTSVVWLDHGAYYVAIAAERSEIAFIVAHLSRRQAD